MQMKTVRECVVVMLIFCLVIGLSLNSWAGEAASTSKEKKEAVAKIQKEEADLTIGTVSGTKVAIDLVNNVPVRGIQFTVKGANMIELRTTTRAIGFLAKFNEVNGVVILASTTDDAVAPGKGAVAEIICKKAPGSELRLSEVIIVGEKRQVLKSPDKK